MKKIEKRSNSEPIKAVTFSNHANDLTPLLERLTFTDAIVISAPARPNTPVKKKLRRHNAA